MTNKLKKKGKTRTNYLNENKSKRLSDAWSMKQDTGQHYSFLCILLLFSKSDIDKIQKPFIHLLLPKIGLNRHTPRALIYGPIYRGGLGIVDLEEYQIVKHFEIFQGHLRRNDDLGLSLRIQLITQKLEIGCGRFFLNTDPNTYKYSTRNTRLSYLWKQCFRFSIHVTLANQWEPWGPSNCDATIMDLAVLDPSVKDNLQKLKHINACRLYLKLLWVRDLLDSATDVELDKDLIGGNRIKQDHPLSFPYQEKPSKKGVYHMERLYI
jgi:hypothetical protein